MSWTKRQLLERASRQLRDTEFSIYSKALLDSGLRDAVDRIKQVIPELKTMTYLENDDDILKLLPSEYSQLLWIMACSRAMEMDERNNEAARYRNEFETILERLVSDIAEGTTIILDEFGNEIDSPYVDDYVQNVRFNIYATKDWDEPQM
jgi:hypothetical protein